MAKRHPQHAVSQWIDHSMKVSEKHYLMAGDDLYDAAANDPVLRAAVESRIPRMLFRGTERPTGRGANRSPHDADGCDFVRAAAESGQGRDRTADTRIFSPTERLPHTTEDYKKARTITGFSSSIIVAVSG